MYCSTGQCYTFTDVKGHFAECRYAECHFAECRYAECHGTSCLTWYTNIIKIVPVNVSVIFYVYNVPARLVAQW
jgi:hypothetical protein